MKITTTTVQRLAARARTLTGGIHGLAFAAHPGEPERFVDRQVGGQTFTGRGAARAAAAFYAGIIDALSDTNRGLVDAVLAETTERHQQQIDAGRRCARRLPPAMEQSA